MELTPTGDMNKRWTIYDVAREAGVSAKTVSRVLNDKPGVGDDTRSRVREIMERVAYYPNIGARTLRGSMRGCVGVTVPTPMDVVPLSQTFFLWLFAKLYETFGRRGEYVCFDMNPLGNHNGDYSRGVWEQLFKACIVLGPLSVNDRIAQRLHESGVPYLVCGRLDSFPECSSACVDLEEGAYISTRFLIERGHRRIAMLKAFSGYQPGVERRRGYLRALEESGVQPDMSLIRSASFTATDNANLVHRLLSDSSVTALIDCSGAEDASSIRTGARRAGRTIGKNVDVVSWTYAEDAAVLNEACAHVWMPLREATAEGIEHLAEWLDGTREGPVNVVYRPVLHQQVTNGEITKPRRLFDIS